MLTNRQLDDMLNTTVDSINQAMLSTAPARERGDAIVDAILGGAASVRAAFEADRAREEAARPAAVLPDCDGFQGTGQRCTACRIRKAMHD